MNAEQKLNNLENRARELAEAPARNHVCIIPCNLYHENADGTLTADPVNRYNCPKCGKPYHGENKIVFNYDPYFITPPTDHRETVEEITQRITAQRELDRRRSQALEAWTAAGMPDVDLWNFDTQGKPAPYR